MRPPATGRLGKTSDVLRGLRGKPTHSTGMETKLTHGNPTLESGKLLSYWSFKLHSCIEITGNQWKMEINGNHHSFLTAYILF
jgi:hypothetical protein